MLQQEKEFKCIGKNCNLCCRDPLTPIELTLGDISRIVNFTNMPPNDFIDLYIDFTPVPKTFKLIYYNPFAFRVEHRYIYQLSLILPCQFWNKGCTIYDSRPISCSLFPYEIIENKREGREDILLNYNQYFDFPCMQASNKLSDDQSIFLEKVRDNIKINEKNLSNIILGDYNLKCDFDVNFFTLNPKLITEELRNLEKLASKYQKEGNEKKFLEFQKLLYKKECEISKDQINNDFGFNPKERLKDLFSKENLEFEFKSTSEYYLKLLSNYKNKL